MKLFATIQQKLIVFILFPIVLSLLLAGAAIDYMLGNFHFKEAKEAIRDTVIHIAAELRRSEAELMENSIVFVKREDIIASVNMINEYQDIKNYRPIIFDEEKKKIALEVMNMAKLSSSQIATVYGADGFLICFAAYGEKGYDAGFVSFDEKGEPVIYTKHEESEQWRPSPAPEHIELAGPSISTGGSYLLQMGNTAYKVWGETFVLEASKPVIRRLYGGKSEAVGNVRLSRVFDHTFVDTISQTRKTPVIFMTEKGKNVGRFLKGLSLGEEVRHSELLFKENIGDYFYIYGNDDFFLNSHVLPAQKGGHIYFVTGYGKTKLNSEIAQSRLYLLLILLISAVIVFPFAFVFMKRAVSDPVNRLAEAVRKAKEGAYEAVGMIRSNDEIALLSRAFNEMAHTIKYREEELRNSEQNLKEAQQIAKVGSWRIDLAGDRTYWSDETFRLYDLKPGSIELGTRTFLEFVHEDDKTMVEKAMESAIALREPKKIEYRIVTVKGAVRTFSCKAQPEFDEKGELIGFVGVNHDITEIKEAQRELEAYKNKLEVMVSEEIAKRMEQEQILIQQSKLAAMGEMIGNIAHQWRQPLNTLGLQIQDIADAYDFGELDKAYLEKSVRESMRVIDKMSDTINDFKDFFKPDKRKVDFTVSEALDDAIPIIDASLKNNFIGIIVDIRQNSVIHGFLNEYSQVLLNIINNAKDALKKSDNPKKIIRIEVDTDEEGRSRVRIFDNGGGIPEDIVEKVFDPYFTTKHKAEGTGIGLYMSKMIIERNMQGQLTAENSGDGALFTITV